MFGREKLIARIKALEAQVRRLENMHAIILPRSSWELPGWVNVSNTDTVGRLGYYNNRQLTAGEIYTQPHHPQPKQVDYRRITNIPEVKANTKNINGVTMEELARYVLDGTPITRKTKEPVTYVMEHGPESVTSKVYTRLGDITTIEKE